MEKNEIKLTTKEKLIGLLREGLFLGLLFIIILVIKHYIFFITLISGESMATNFRDGEFYIVNKTYNYENISRGDVIIFEEKIKGEHYYLIKRVIGVGGEEIKIEGGNVYVKKQGSGDFKKLDEKYLNENNYGKTIGSIYNGKYRLDTTEKVEFKIPTGKLFVMGDNRNHSTDSRHCFEDCNMDDNRFVSKDNYKGVPFLSMGGYSFVYGEFFPWRGFNFIKSFDYK